MAKGQQRSNREPKKPKASKKPAAAARPSFVDNNSKSPTGKPNSK